MDRPVLLRQDVRGGAAEAHGIAARTRLFVRATSLGGVESLIGLYQSLLSQLHNHAIQENVGEMPGLMISLDATLRSIENHFSAEEIGTESVATHPNFNPVKPPPPPSPV